MRHLRQPDDGEDNHRDEMESTPLCPPQYAGPKMPPRKPTVTTDEGSSVWEKRSRAWVYLGRELGFPYAALGVAVFLIWYGVGWMGPNVFKPMVEANVNKDIAITEVLKEVPELTKDVRASLADIRTTMQRQSGVDDAQTRAIEANTKATEILAQQFTELLKRLKNGNM